MYFFYSILKSVFLGGFSLGDRQLYLLYAFKPISGSGLKPTILFEYSMLPSIRTLQFNFPLLIARALKFGPEKIYLVLNMTKDSLTFLPLVPSRN